MAVPAFTFINVQPSSTMYIVWTNTPSIRIGNVPRNLNYNQLMRDSTATTPASFTYDGSSKPNNINSVTQMIPTAPIITTTAYVWVNTDPTTSPTIPSDTVNTFAATILQSSSDINPIVQFSGIINNRARLYYVYTSRPANIVNNTTNTLQALGIPNTLQLNNLPYPSLDTLQNAIVVISPASSRQVSFTDSEGPNGNIFIWRGSQQPSNLADYAANFRSYDFLLQDSASASPSTMKVEINGDVITVSDIICTSNTQCPNGQICSNGKCVVQGIVGSQCTANSDCIQGLACINGSCQIPSTNGGGFPRWGWLLIGLAIVIIIAIFIFLVYHSRSKPKVKATPPRLLSH